MNSNNTTQTIPTTMNTIRLIDINHKDYAGVIALYGTTTPALNDIVKFAIPLSEYIVARVILFMETTSISPVNTAVIVHLANLMQSDIKTIKAAVALATVLKEQGKVLFPIRDGENIPTVVKSVIMDIVKMGVGSVIVARAYKTLLGIGLLQAKSLADIVVRENMMLNHSTTIKDSVFVTVETIFSSSK